jgi:uncharacterized protein (TIGR02217 family)
MAFLEQRLSERIERGAVGGPVNRGRRMTRTNNGRVKQVFNWAAPLHEYTISHGVLSGTAREQLLAMWYVVNFTPYEGFRFRDWSDYTATQSNSRCTLITGSTYQLQRVYTVHGLEYLRDITKPVSGAVIYRTRSAVITTASHTLDTATGIATISGHVGGDTYTWAGTFEVPVTFSGDEWVQLLESNAGGAVVVTSPQIKLEEIRV